MRLDKYLIKQGYSRKAILQLLTKQAITVNGCCATQRDMPVNHFDHITINNQPLKQQQAYYLMMNKPAGILSATQDNQHTTAIDLIKEEFAKQLHIAGRLDRATTGLLILTNDGNWSRKLTEPQQKIPKRYRVKTVYAISPDTQQQFFEGIFFKYENLTTTPAELEIIDECNCILTIYEGRYHQVKRMFAAVGNRVESLHRIAMGNIELDSSLVAGEYRFLTVREVASLA